MKRIVTDPTDSRLGHGSNETPVPQNEAYLVLSDEERARGFVRPVRSSYRHMNCPSASPDNPHPVTTMGDAIAETYAQDPAFYGATYCCTCQMHRPVGADGEFTWLDGTKVGT